MASEGSSVSKTQASAYNFARSRSRSRSGRQIRQDQQQRPPNPGSPDLGYTSNDNYLVQDPQGFISNPLDFGLWDRHLYPNSPAVDDPAHRSYPASVGFPPGGTHQHQNQPFIANDDLGGPAHLEVILHNSAATNIPAWCSDDEARPGDGSSPFALGESIQVHPSATTAPALCIARSLASLSPNTPAASSPLPAGKREKPHECVFCPTGKRRFASARDLQRHQNTSHKNNKTRVYICWCGGRGSVTSRKDNHVRHVHLCHRQPQHSACYSCICGLSNFGKDVHLSHVQNCGRTRNHRRRSTRSPRSP